MSRTQTINYRQYIAIGSLALALFLGAQTAAASTHAHTLTSAAPEAGYLELKAKVVFLETLLAALKEGDSPVVAPTFAMGLDGNVAMVAGTVLRTPNADMMEICGPMSKGLIDWGDGFSEPLHGLGCSGDMHTFMMYHVYAERGSYEITVTDNENRTETKVIAAGTGSADTAALLELTLDETVTAAGNLSATTEACTEDALAAVITWGDGARDTVACGETTYELEHTYATPGTYKVLVRTADGDVAQELVMIAE